MDSLLKHKSLILRLAKREVIARYRGSIFGMLWTWFNPILMLCVYSFVFTVVFKARWGQETDALFPVIIFSGLMLHNLFAECLSRSSFLITDNVSYVKKVVFPVEILPWVTIISALFHLVVSFLILYLAVIFINETISWTVLFLPLLILPLIILIYGLCCFVSSLAVYVRDTSQVVALIIPVTLFMCPIFYPLNVIPEDYQIYLFLNPLTFAVEGVREILIFNRVPNFKSITIFWIISIAVYALGKLWFNKLRKGFADVI